MYSIPAMAWAAGEGAGGATFGSVDGGGCVFKIAPMIKKSDPIPIADIKSESLRPRVSTPKNMKMAVATTLMIPITDKIRTGNISRKYGVLTIDTTGQKGVLSRCVANRRKDLRSIVAERTDQLISSLTAMSYILDRVLASPLLKDENEERDEEPNKIALPEESFLPVDTSTCYILFFDGCLNLSHLSQHSRVRSVRSA